MLMSGPRGEGPIKSGAFLRSLEKAIYLSGWEYFMLLALPGGDLVGAGAGPNLLVSMENNVERDARAQATN
jgi:hypothetical protein